MKVWAIIPVVVILCTAGCTLSQRGRGADMELIEGLQVAPELRYSDIPVPRGFVYIPRESWTYEGKGKVRLADLYYRGKSNIQVVADFFLEQMPISGWEKEMVVGIETKKRLRFKHTRKSDNCEIIIERSMGNTYIQIRIN